jgi:hypothetical protein
MRLRQRIGRRGGRINNGWKPVESNTGIFFVKLSNIMFSLFLNFSQSLEGIKLTKFRWYYERMVGLGSVIRDLSYWHGRSNRTEEILKCVRGVVIHNRNVELEDYLAPNIFRIFVTAMYARKFSLSSFLWPTNSMTTLLVINVTK